MAGGQFPHPGASDSGDPDREKMSLAVTDDTPWQLLNIWGLTPEDRGYFGGYKKKGIVGRNAQVGFCGTRNILFLNLWDSYTGELHKCFISDIPINCIQSYCIFIIINTFKELSLLPLFFVNELQSLYCLLTQIFNQVSNDLNQKVLLHSVNIFKSRI